MSEDVPVRRPKMEFLGQGLKSESTNRQTNTQTNATERTTCHICCR